MQRIACLVLSLLPPLVPGWSAARCALQPPLTVTPSRRRCAAIAAAAAAADGDPSSDEESQGPVVPIDFGATERERIEGARRAPATAGELAAHLPPWAAQIALDPELNQEYEATQQKGRAAALKKTSVEGRTWEGIDNTYDDPEGATAGAAQFTPSELAEDYNLPLEGVCEALLDVGVPRERINIGRPVHSFCSQPQLTQLLEFLATCDPIAAREARAEETLEEMAEGTRLSAEDLLTLCRKASIEALLGVDTRVKAGDYALLRESMERELAWLPEEAPRLESTDDASES